MSTKEKYSAEERLRYQAEVISLWFDWLEEKYADLLSRRSELDSASGFDAEPSSRPCEHRLEWMRGKLCTACDNTGWRKLTKQEREQNLGIDPYATEVKRGVTIVRDQSPAEKKARDAQRLDRIIEQLQHDELVRAGLRVQGTLTPSDVVMFGKKPRSLRRILRGVEQLRRHYPDAPLRSASTLRALALMLGRLEPPPEAR